MRVFVYTLVALYLTQFISPNLSISPSASPKMVKESQIMVAIDQDIPVIDMSLERSRVSMQIVKACETIGFFKVVNHGVDPDVISRMELESINFFDKPVLEKRAVRPVVKRPFGYGLNDIGVNGDVGEVEYFLLHTNPLFLSQLSFGNDSSNFGSAVTRYVEAVKQLACEILDLTAEGLRVPPHTFSKLIRAVDSDSVLRLNHYPSSDHYRSGAKSSDLSVSLPRVGFGEHTDPQILTVLRSNGVGGLQVAFPDGRWVPVSPDPTAFCVNVGDLLQIMTNGRFISVRHRAVTTGHASRLSTAYFASPPVHAKIGPLQAIITASDQPRLYRTFTWADYKKFAYSLRLGDNRLDIFRSWVNLE